MRKIFLLGFLLILVLILTREISAQGVGTGISPLVFELTGNPGDIIENQAYISNPSDNPIGIKMTVEDIAPSGEEGQVIVEKPETETYSMARWIKCEPEEFALQPKEGKWVKFTITIPENAEPGGHYGTVVAGSAAVAGAAITGAAIAPRVGTLVLLTVPGEMKEILTVKEFSAPYYSEYGAINFAVKFENTGTVHVRPKSLITITNLFGKKVADIYLPEKNVLPGAVRKIEATWNQKWLWGGKYTATLTGNYGTYNNFLLSPAVISFWAFPWKFGVAILVVIILLILSRRRWAAAFKVLIKGQSKS